MADGGHGVVTWQVTVAGKAIPDYYKVDAIEVDHAVNRIARARIRLRDGDPAKQDFPISASATFLPGTAISIGLGYDCGNAEVFAGIVTGQTIALDGRTHSTLEVECQDRAVMLTTGRKSATHEETQESEAIARILGAAGLEADIAPTGETVAGVVQYDATDWDFIVSRAEANGMLVLTLNGTVKVFDPRKPAAPTVTLTHGVDLLRFQGELNAIGQLGDVTARAWDPLGRDVLAATASSSLAGPGNLATKKLAELMGQGEYVLHTAAARSSADLERWAQAQVTKSELAKIVATAGIGGRTDLAAGQAVTLAGLGERFDGSHLVTGMRHEVRDGAWRCELKLGHERHWFAETRQLHGSPAAGLLPGAQGLFNATVLKIDADPDKQFRIKVKVALFGDDEGLWARLAQFYATDSQGAFFMPEIGDEVVLGFLNADPRFPVVLGSVYGRNRAPNAVLAPDADNSQKALYSKNGLYVLFNDKDKVLTLSTPGGNKLVLDDKNGQVRLVDQHANAIQLDKDGITVKSAAAIAVHASKTLALKGDSGVTAESASGDFAAKGANVALTAQAQLTAKGSAGAEIQGGAQLVLKAGMVMIN